MLTIERLKELLHYDPETGIFRWIIAIGKKHKASEIAGTINRVGYLRIGIDKKRYYSHRLAWFYMTGEFPENEIDHIDGERTNNIFENLRDVSSSVNKQNKHSCRADNHSSGLLGVTWNKAANKWQASISIYGKFKYLGCFETKELAYSAYVTAKRNIHEGCTI